MAPVGKRLHDWENRTVFNCGVAQIDGAIVLIYRAQGTASNVSRLGFAVSTDGFTFGRLDRPVDLGRRDGQEPIVSEVVAVRGLSR